MLDEGAVDEKSDSRIWLKTLIQVNNKARYRGSTLGRNARRDNETG